MFQVIQSISLTADIYSCQATVTSAVPKQLRTHLIQSDCKARMIHNSNRCCYIYSLSAGSGSRYYSLKPWGKARAHTPPDSSDRWSLSSLSLGWDLIHSFHSVCRFLHFNQRWQSREYKAVMKWKVRIIPPSDTEQNWWHNYSIMYNPITNRRPQNQSMLWAKK